MSGPAKDEESYDEQTFEEELEARGKEADMKAIELKNRKEEAEIASIEQDNKRKRLENEDYETEVKEKKCKSMLSILKELSDFHLKIRADYPDGSMRDMHGSIQWRFTRIMEETLP